MMIHNIHSRVRPAIAVATLATQFARGGLAAEEARWWMLALLAASLTAKSVIAWISGGAAYGLRQSLDTVGAFAGPLLAMLLMLAVSRRLITQHTNVTAGRWHGNSPPTVHEVRNRVLGIIGLAQGHAVMWQAAQRQKSTRTPIRLVWCAPWKYTARP